MASLLPLQLLVTSPSHSLVPLQLQVRTRDDPCLFPHTYPTPALTGHFSRAKEVLSKAEVEGELGSAALCRAYIALRYSLLCCLCHLLIGF